MKDPLKKRYLRDLRDDFGKYFVIFILMVLSIALTSGFLVADGSMIRAYLDNPRFDLNTGVMRNSVRRTWNYMDRLGLLDEYARRINIDKHINVDLYKEALDECTERYGDDNPKFYEKL